MDNEELEKIMKESTEFVDRLKDKVHEQYFEIERLNNIINKIIEFLQREQIEKGEYSDFLIENKQIKVQEVLDKIKELKRK